MPHRTFAAGQTLGDDYTTWIVQSFSGVLCVAEVYQGDLALLLAVDPGAPDGDRLVGYEFVQGSVQQPAVEGFLERLRDAGIAPAEVVTDGSALYPEVVARVWPQAAHQLCLFHETRRLLRAAMAIAPEVRAALPTPPRRPNRAGALLRRFDPQAPSPDDRDARIALARRLRAEGAGVREITRRMGHSRNTIRTWLRGTVRPVEERAAPPETTSRQHPAPEPPPPAGWASWDQVRCFRQRLKSHRWSVVARLQRLSEADRAVVAELLDAPVGAPLLSIVHRWAQEWYAIWHNDAGRRRPISEARERFLRWREDAEDSTLAGLRQVQRRMTDERFASLSHFLRPATPAGRRQATARSPLAGASAIDRAPTTTCARRSPSGRSWTSWPTSVGARCRPPRNSRLAGAGEVAVTSPRRGSSRRPHDPPSTRTAKCLSGHRRVGSRPLRSGPGSGLSSPPAANLYHAGTLCRRGSTLRRHPAPFAPPFHEWT